jgi:transposase-like protein
VSPQFILVAVGWCLRCFLSCRDIEELLLERGVPAVTAWRWVLRYAHWIINKTARDIYPWQVRPYPALAEHLSATFA